MKIGVDCSPLSPQLTGVGNYLYRLLLPLVETHPEDTFYLYAIRTSPSLEKLASFTNVHLRINPSLGFSEALWSQTTLARLCMHDQIDLFWGPSQAIPLFGHKNRAHVMTVHDFSYRLFPKTVSFIRRWFLCLFSPSFYRKAEIVTPISFATKKKLANLFSREAEYVIPPSKYGEAQNPQEILLFLQELGLEQRKYFLMVGSLEPRKNHLQALRAYAKISQKKKLYPLVLAGKKVNRSTHVYEEVSRLQKAYPDKIRYVEYLDDLRLKLLISGARSLLMPSLYEGYGMPIMEARCSETPVIITDVDEMIEASEEDARVMRFSHFDEDLEKHLTHLDFKLSKPSYQSAHELSAQLYQAFQRAVCFKREKSSS